MQKNKKFKRLIFVVLSSIFIMISGICYVSGQTTSVATPTQTATSTTTPSTTTPTVTPGGTTTETPSITPPTTSTTEPGESSTETATPVPTPSVTCSVSTMPSLSSESCSHSGSIQYKPCGDCSTNSRTCCEQMKWSDWGAPCPDYEEPHVCVGMKSWSENLGRCACAEEPGFYASSGPTTATVSNNKKLDDNCVWVCDRTDCPTGFQFNTETCKCHKVRNIYTVKDSTYINGKVNFLCNYDNHWATFQCNSLQSGSVGSISYNNYPSSYYTNYSNCPEKLSGCNLGSYCRQENDPCKEKSSSGDIPTTTVGWGTHMEKCGISFDCPSEAQCISGTGVIFERPFSGSVNLMQCTREFYYYGFFPGQSIPAIANPSDW